MATVTTGTDEVTAAFDTLYRNLSGFRLAANDALFAARLADYNKEESGELWEAVRITRGRYEGLLSQLRRLEVEMAVGSVSHD